MKTPIGDSLGLSVLTDHPWKSAFISLRRPLYCWIIHVISFSGLMVLIYLIKTEKNMKNEIEIRKINELESGSIRINPDQLRTESETEAEIENSKIETTTSTTTKNIRNIQDHDSISHEKS